MNVRPPLSMPVRRACKCGCGATFMPPVKKPGQEYLFGHKTASGNAPKAKIKATTLGRTETDRRALDYRMALASAQRELKEIEASIDKADNEMVQLLTELHYREKQKEDLTEKHLNLATTVQVLSALVEGRSIAREVQTEAQ
jgi:hypothetical protein